MNDAQVLAIVFIGLLIYSFYTWVKAWHRKRLAYSLKVSANAWRFPVHLIWICYVMIGVMNFMPTVTSWAVTHTSSDASTLGQILIRYGVPIVYQLTFIVFAVWVMKKSIKPWFKYNDKEKQWQEEDKQKFKARLPRILQWIAR